MAHSIEPRVPRFSVPFTYWFRSGLQAFIAHHLLVLERWRRQLDEAARA